MNIQTIKQELSKKTGANLVTLSMVRQFEDEAQTLPAPWLSHWDNDNRIRVAMHDDVFTILKANPSLDTLAYKTSVKEATTERAAYIIYTVIIPAHIEGTF